MNFTYVEKQDGIAVVWLDQPGEKINKISTDLLGEFTALLDDLESDANVQAAVLISRKVDNFIAGADIEQFLEMTEPGEAERLSRGGNSLLLRMARSSKPIVAAINGAALGGGLEVALACHSRIVTDHPKTVLGLPEVQLGILPAGGGTQRLPRLVGLQRALDLLLTGKNVYPYPARKMGLADLIIHPSGLLDAARKMAAELASGRRSARKRKRTFLQWLLEGNPLGRKLVFRKARQMVMKRTRGNYPAPLKILECVRTGLNKGIEAGLRAESENFGYLMRTPQSRQLINLFFGMNAAKKNPLKDQVRPVKRIGVLGAGLMGSGIAEVSANKGLEVFLKDVGWEGLSSARKSISKNLEGKVRKRIISPFERDQVLARIHSTVEYTGFQAVQLIVEAVFEDLEVKKTLLRELEGRVHPDAIFASNTSSLPITEIAQASERPEQVIGMHYFSPVQKMPLLEIIVTDKTADWVTASAYEVGLRQGKTVIVVKDGPGFYTTRILSPMMNEALLVMGEGARVEELDRAMKDFGFPVGPATLMDEVGLDVGAHVGDVLAPLFAARGQTPENKALELVEAGYKGRKNKRGFYRYGKKKEVNSEIYRHFGGSARQPIDVAEVQHRLAFTLVNEAVLCLQEGILTSPRDGDLGAVLGLGFPPFLGGPFRYLDSLGTPKALERLQSLQAKHGPRFTPAPLLVEKAKAGKSFY